MKRVLFFLALSSFLFADPIKIAMDNQFPPFEFQKGSKIIGFDVDFAEELAKRVGFEFQIVQTQYDNACSAINSGNADIGISAFGDDDATRDCDHGVSYFESEYIFIKDKATRDINYISDLKDKKVAYDRDSSAMKDILTELEAKPVPKKSGTIVSTLLSLYEGKVDAAIIDSCNAPIVRGKTEFVSQRDLTGLGLIDNGGLDRFVIFHEQQAYDSETFVIFPKDGRHEELKNKINNAILQMRNDGTIPNLLKKYGLD